MKANERNWFRARLASAGRTALGAVLLLGLIGMSTRGAEPASLRIENESYAVEVGLPNGVIMRIRDKVGGLELLGEPRLADNFKFTLPVRKRHAWQSTEGNYILGREQRLSSHEVSGSKLALVWGGPMKSSTGKRHRVSASMTIELAGADIRFTFRIRNRSALEIGEVYCPILGGWLGLGENPELRRQTELVLPGLADLRKEPIFRSFASHSWLGVFGPEQFYGYPDTLSMPWLELHQPTLERGVYLGAHDSAARYKVIHLEMVPGVAGARPDGNWPRPEELNGAPAGVKVSFVYFPYQPARQEFEAAPMVLSAHKSGGSEGARAYGRWLASSANLRRSREDWLGRALASQECDAVPFKELPGWARQANGAGLNNLLLTHWRVGPEFDPDPRLGSREDFVEAVRQCHAAGVKVMVAVDLPPVSQLTDRFRDRLRDFVCMDRWGIPYSVVQVSEPSPLTGGFGAGERRVWLNPGHPGMRRWLVGQIRELAALGVDGIEVGEFFARPLDFNPTVGRSPDRASWEGGLECLREIRQACRAVNPGFAVSTDAIWDQALRFSQVSSAELRERCPLRVAFPDWQPALKVVDDDGISAVNRALLSSARLRIVPADRKPLGGPATASVAGYLRAVLAVRDALSQTLIDGERLDADGLRAEGRFARALFRNAATGLRTAVLVNNRPQPARVRIDGFAEPGPKPFRLWLPSQGTTNLVFPAQIEIPERQLAILTEEDSIERVRDLARWTPPVRHDQVVFELASAEDLEGWSLELDAFSINSLASLIPGPTLNSLAARGETAIGTALSPTFQIEPGFTHMDLLFQGGRSSVSNGEQNLVIQIIDAQSGAVLEEILPPGTHVLGVRRVPVDRLHGKSVRLKLVDNNTDSSYAWIGLRRVTLVK